MTSPLIFWNVVAFNLVVGVLLILQFTATGHWYDLAGGCVCFLAVIWFAMDERED